MIRDSGAAAVGTSLGKTSVLPKEGAALSGRAGASVWWGWEINGEGSIAFSNRYRRHNGDGRVIN